ncbi:hypothetical protein A7985_02735 [Pseudoalteromonas luteoviolacea]|uniref:Energy-coupling factor ABC transporter permease n=1 Tax=Pseudoalteromonas luteoviolacea TaxID=43657 RepID=A0A1C0TU83_9GAMM|nr:energy-coupling factor ABC transporter permease [Pseudoalteromonas luteoviolacea]OCQ22891.1 hypothetical protein A7985_02735 [Pseudoalteromonas luteoviolacea]
MTTFVFALIAFVLSLDKLQYEALLRTPQRQIGVLSCALIMALLWQIKAGILPDLNIHILAVTAVTLILGWRLSLFSTLLATIFCYFLASFEVSFFSFWLLNGILPVYLSYALFLLCYHYLPRHFFIYIFVCSFISAGLVAAIKIIFSGAYYWSIDQYDWYVLTSNYMFYAVIMWFPEAMLNGMAITLLITYRPHWVRTFYDKEYLDR